MRNTQCQTDALDHYQLFMSLLRIIYEETPELRKNVLTQTKFTDLFWKYFEFTEYVRGMLNHMPKIRAAKTRDQYGKHLNLTNTEQDRVARVAQMKEFVEKHAEIESKQLMPADSQTELVHTKNVAIEMNGIGVRSDLKEAEKMFSVKIEDVQIAKSPEREEEKKIESELPAVTNQSATKPTPTRGQKMLAPPNYMSASKAARSDSR